VALPRPFALVHTADQWCRAAHTATALERATGAVRLAGEPEPERPGEPGELPIPGGLAFDPWCRLFRSLPEEGRIERVLRPGGNPAAAAEEMPAADLFEVPAAETDEDEAGFHPTQPAPGPLNEPRGLAVDDEGRLYVAEAGAGRVLVVDLVERRVLRQVRFPLAEGGFGKPVDVATDGRRVWVGIQGVAFVAEIDGRGGPKERALPEGVTCDRIACRPSTGGLFVLQGAGTAEARVVALGPPALPSAGRGGATALSSLSGSRHETIGLRPPSPALRERGPGGEGPLAWPVPFATDLEFESPAVLVVARRPGEELLRFDPETGQPDDHPRATARGFDGRAIVRTPEGRIGFWTVRGLRTATLVRIRYAPAGRVTTFQLDSGAYQTVWGRLFLDACIPAGTSVRVHCATADEIPEGPALPRTPPATGCPTGPLRGESPPMPPLSLIPAALPAPAGATVFRPLHRRRSGRELPWTPVPETGDPLADFQTYEAPVAAPPGRFLWVTLELRGAGRSTPRVKSLRAERPGHDLLRRLPRTYSREARAADFLRRFLAPLDGVLGDLDARATHRRALLDPASAPAEALPWLAGFLGLALDERWPVAARRQLIAEAAWLFRFRGTLPGLRRFLELCLGEGVLLIEHWRLRGLGGSLVGEAGPASSRAVVGAGFRVGGALGEPDEVFVGGASPADAFATHAHRFTVIVPRALSAEERSMAEHVLEEHRPAHTLYEMCTGASGLRVGVGTLAAISTRVGRGAAFEPLEVGGSLLGRDAVIGRPVAGARPGASRAGFDSHVG
jgi:phage tail-like protein